MKPYIPFLGLTLMLAGCSDFLDVNPTDRYSQTTYWKTREQAEAALLGVYNTLTSTSLYAGQLPLETASPNHYGYDNTGGGNFIAQGIHDAANNAIINNKWGICYQGIGRANTLLDNIGGITMDEATKKRFVAEAKFLRALYYFNLWNYYGGVPLILETPNVEKHGQLPRNTADQVQAQIVKDCDEALADLPVTVDSKGKASKGAANALKARTLLYAGKWVEAAAASKAIIDAKTYSLFADYRELFQLDKENNAEVIFDVQFKFPEFVTSNDIQLTDFNSVAPLPDLARDYYMRDGLPADKSPLYDAKAPFANRDPRLNQTLILPGTTFRATTVAANRFGFTGIGQKKYTVYKDTEAGTTVAGGQSQINYMVFRYADVLLIYAEAQNEAVGPDASVYDAINQVRKRAGMPNVTPGLTKEQMRVEIRHERRIELAGEGLYYDDIRRWRTAEVVMNTDIFNFAGAKIGTRKFNKDRDYLWPIPTIVSQLNPNLTQNPGYGK